MTTDDLRTRFRTPIRVWAILLPLITAGLLGLVRGELAAATSVLVLVLVVVAFSATGDRVAGVLAAVSSGVWFDWFLTAPYQRLAIDDPDDAEAVVLLVLVGLAVSQVAWWGVRARERSGRQEGYLRGLGEAADAVAGLGEGGGADVVRRVEAEVARVLGAERCRFEAGSGPAARATVLHRDGTVHRHDVVLDLDRDGWPTDDTVVVPVGAGGAGRGVLRVTSAGRVARPTLEQRRVAVLLADVLATTRPAVPGRDDRA